jgi:hypothetical protein
VGRVALLAVAVPTAAEAGSCCQRTRGDRKVSSRRVSSTRGVDAQAEGENESDDDRHKSGHGRPRALRADPASQGCRSAVAARAEALVVAVVLGAEQAVLRVTGEAQKSIVSVGYDVERVPKNDAWTRRGGETHRCPTLAVAVGDEPNGRALSGALDPALDAVAFTAGRADAEAVAVEGEPRLPKRRPGLLLLALLLGEGRPGRQGRRGREGRLEGRRVGPVELLLRGREVEGRGSVGRPVREG